MFWRLGGFKRKAALSKGSAPAWGWEMLEMMEMMAEEMSEVMEVMEMTAMMVEEMLEMIEMKHVATDEVACC